MNRCVMILAALLLAALLALGCSSGGADPVVPAADPATTAQVSCNVPQTHLWGYYDCCIDIENQTVEVVENRSGMFAANVVTFVNGNPANLSFNIKGTPVGSGCIDVDIDVSIRHPFPGMTQYNGYDVRGVFCGDGTSSLEYNSDLHPPVIGPDQFMLMKPGGSTGAPDGYTRWYNRKEFGTPGICGYTPGIFASKNFAGTATLMPYKYFADGLGSTEDIWEFLVGTGDDGVFSAGKTNTRNYYLRFPTEKGIVYGYAIVANWINEDTHPANAVEPVACTVDITDNIYYVDDTDNGGDLIADISLWAWNIQPDAIYIESNLFGLHELDSAEMIPIGGTETYSIYHVEIPTEFVTGTEGNEFWVIAEMDGFDYKNTFGIPNTCGNDKLAAFFRYDIFTADVPYNKPPVIVSGVDGEAEPIEFTTEIYTVDATDPDGDSLTYSWTVTDANGDPVEGYDGIAGNGAGSLNVYWGTVAGWTQGMTPFDIDCIVSDGMDETPATTLEAELWVEGDIWVSNHPDFGSIPDHGTQAEPYTTITQALNSGYTTGAKIIVDYGIGMYYEQVYRSYGNGFTLRGWSWHTAPAGRPVITYSGNFSVIYIDYTSNVKIQGFEISPSTGTTESQLIYGNYAHGISFIDCHVTGTLNDYYFYPMYLNYCNNITVKNCKFSDLNISTTSTTAYINFYFYRGNGVHNVVRNEFTELQESPQIPGNLYIYMYAYYWPANSNWSNNLIHHISPSVATHTNIYLNRINYPYPYVHCVNNTVDSIDADSGTNSVYSNIYGMYLYSQGYDVHSNIITNLDGNWPNPLYTGVLTSYYEGTDYMDVWNIQDTRYSGYAEGPNSIGANPLYVNNTTEPYDYHLDTGSPCIGTGKLGVDMGCYGNLPAGETVVGLLTPE